MKAALPMLVKYSSFCLRKNPKSHGWCVYRYDYGLAGNGRQSNCKRDANWWEMVGVEWWKENRLRVERRPVGWKDWSHTRLDYCYLLARCLFRRVSFFLYRRALLNWRLISIYYLYKLVRRPRLILDFALTLVFNHLVLSTYYSSSLPTSLFFWIVMLAGAALTIIVAEQLCVRREMSEGLSVLSVRPEDELVEEMEMGGLLPRID